jgi:3-deoxy-manno-octulosonate cytidylyltransferase (CMP-KDO synthetase)
VVLAVIPARYDSTRLPGKVLAGIGGAPMVVRVWERVRGAVDRVVVATDDGRVAEACRAAGAEVAWTGPCGCGTDRVAEAAARFPTASVVVNVQGDEPLVEPGLVREVAAAVLSGAGIATAAAPLADPSDPSRVKVVTDHASRALYFSRLPIPWHGPWWVHIGVYAFRPDVLGALRLLPPSELERSERLEQLRWLELGYAIHVVAAPAAPLSVDTEADLVEVRRQWSLLPPPVTP